MRLHFIGIGGIGISALAKYYLRQGHKISGSDIIKPVVFSAGESKKIKFFLGHKEGNISKNIDLIIYTAAVTKDNPELKRAEQLGISRKSYAKALGELTKKYYTIAVSGMHGKSTTTAMIAMIMIKAGLDPTVIIGSKIKEFGNKKDGSNFRLGKSKYLLIEADEFNASFLNYWPKLIVITNIEEEHLDYFRDLNRIMQTFKKYISRLKKNGILVINSEDKNIAKLIFNFHPSTSLGVKFSIFKPRIAGQSSPKDNKLPTGQALRSRQNSNFKIKNYSLKQRKEVKKLKNILKVPGEHNISNALAALTAARELNIPDEISYAALADFKGIWRRFEYKGEINGAKIYDDYGHHPTEIKSTLSAARQIIKEGGRLFIVFQPHQYHRTFILFNQFTKAFDLADKILLLDIYSVEGRENESIKRKVNSRLLTEAMRRRKKDVLYVSSFEKAAGFLKCNLRPNDLVIIMGAGDVYRLTKQLFKN